MNNIANKTKSAAIGALTLVLAYSTHAQTLPFTKAGTGQPALPPAAEATASAPSAPLSTNAVQQFLDKNLPDVLSQGKIDLDVRARVEDASEFGVKGVNQASFAPTVRTRLGYTTGSLYGFQGMAEGQNTSVLGAVGNYNAAGSNGRGYKPTVGDAPVTDLDQLWLGYSYTNMFDIKGGRVRLNLDNQRFVGDVDWRQNIQTFDMATFHVQPVDNLNFLYAYVWDVHRAYGDVSGLPAANKNYASDSHLLNLSYSGWKYARFVLYSYLLDLTNYAGANNSCATYGGYFAGNAGVGDKLSLDYRAEFAWQDNYGDSALRYSADYANLEAGMNYQPIAAGAGWEDLGSGVNSGAGGGRAAFRTPLATLHAFDGWAEMFQTGPSAGLHDLYGYFQVTLPAHVPVRFVYHKFDSDAANLDLGQEFDLIATKNFGKHWQALLEYAYYKGQDIALPAITASHLHMQRIVAQLEFNF